MKKKVSNSQDFEDRIRQYGDREAAILKSLGLQKRPIINFPKRKAGFFAKLAISFITASGGILDTQFFNLRK